MLRRLSSFFALKTVRRRPSWSCQKKLVPAVSGLNCGISTAPYFSCKYNLCAQAPHQTNRTYCTDFLEGSSAARVPVSEVNITTKHAAALMEKIVALPRKLSASRKVFADLDPGLRALSVNQYVMDKSYELGLSHEDFPTLVSKFRVLLRRAYPELPELQELVLSASRSGNEDAVVLQVLFPLFWELIQVSFPRLREAAEERERAEKGADLSNPAIWYPRARALTRTIIFHMGPTNSGKTYRSLMRLQEASSGVYAAPLRLLAMEVWDRCNSSGVVCSLLTGQEVNKVPFSQHVSCTVEMMSIGKEVEVAVIDEIQMLSDPDRGWAWTRALYGVPALEVHVCGDPTALGLIKHAAEISGDRLIVHQYDRITPLQIAPRPVETYREIRPGDCVVAFARRDIFKIKQEIEFYTSNKCSIVYGKLPPETRRQQAKMFNEVDSGVDVLVASDAVGMGLNLNIGRVIFHTLEKYNGIGFETVPAPQIKQIAGRAGRHGTLYAEGWATCRSQEDMAVLIDGISTPPVPAKAAGIFPTVEQMTSFALTMPDAPLATILERFMSAAKVDGNFFLCRHKDMLAMANALHHIEGLSLRERFMFMAAPVSSEDSVVMSSLLEYAEQYARGEAVQLLMDTKMQLPKDDKSMKEMEDIYRIFALYQWLSVRMEVDTTERDIRVVDFPMRDLVESKSEELATLMGEGLAIAGRRDPTKKPLKIIKKRETKEDAARMRLKLKNDARVKRRAEERNSKRGKPPK